MSVQGIRWYGGAFLALIGSAAALGFFGLSFFSSFTPLYVSIVCSVLAIACGVVAAARARPSETARARDGAPSDLETDRQDEEVQTVDGETGQRDEGAGPQAKAAQPGEAE